MTAAIGAGTAATRTVSELESNNTLASANGVGTAGTIVNGTMASSSDTDYFVVQVPAGKTLTATLTPVGSTADYDLYVYNSAGTQLGKSVNSAGMSDAVSSANSTSATSARYVGVVYYSGGTGATSGKYTLKLSW
ncbi:MAG: hypothetical protein ACXWC4_18800 [Telluria sp.]